MVEDALNFQKYVLVALVAPVALVVLVVRRLNLEAVRPGSDGVQLCIAALDLSHPRPKLGHRPVFNSNNNKKTRKLQL